MTTYRLKVFTGAMLTCCQNTMREVCTDLSAELVEFNGQADHVRLLVAYPPILAISQLVRRLEGRPPTPRPANTPQQRCARPHARTPLLAVLLCRFLPRRSTFDHQALHRRLSPTTLKPRPLCPPGPRPPANRTGLSPDRNPG
ncbi:transposase [Mycobacterium marinum]|uniref:transposase n=1 Tax=Mycobacterium marinum TaxID=1781 RepID=UPI0021C34E5A|nr:transposase [Mycobacterium marinum]